MTVRIYMILVVLLCLGLRPAMIQAHPQSQTDPAVDNILANGDFEAGTAGPYGWASASFASTAIFTWDDTQSYTGSRSVKIEAASPDDDDAYWSRTVTVQPNTDYVLSGWIRTENVSHSAGSVDAGANLSLYGTWTHSDPLFGTNDWTYVSLPFNSGNDTEVTIAARLGYWSGTTTGTAWFDDIQLQPVDPSILNPRWRILVLIYDTSDFTYQDGSGEHHVMATMSQAEIDWATESAHRFFETDVPALNSGHMYPLLTIRYPDRALTDLDPFCGYWPSRNSIAPEIDPAFDSILVIWDSSGTDLNTGQPLNLQNCGGLTAPNGTGQTHTTFQVDSVAPNQRNVFKHEWGHSILFYYDAAGTAPYPTVDNHINDTDTRYVHCPTGEAYILQDETDDNPIPNSIYNNYTGFTHDYYSGTTATPDQPTRCLGITPVAWASGGPVTGPPCNDPYEPNNSRAEATALTYGSQTTDANICPQGDEDYYVFNGTAGDQIVADIDAADSGSPLDFELYLYDSGGNVLAYNDDDNSLDSYIEYMLPADGVYYLMVRSLDNAAGRHQYVYTLHLSGTGSPDIDVSATALSQTLTLNDAATNTLTIENNGTVDLDYEIRRVNAASPGDTFGYTFLDSTQPNGPTYEWHEIAPPAGGSGAELSALTDVDDGYYWPLPLPFTFNFYGTDYTEVAVASNGTIYFEDRDLGLGNIQIPGSTYDGVQRFIAPLWDDLVVEPGAIYYQALADRLILEYYQISACCNSPDHATWQVVLFDTGGILFQYQDVSFGDIQDKGGEATIGIQGDATMGLQYAYNTPALTDNLAIRFLYPRPVPWLSVTPDSGTLPIGATQTVTVTWDAREPGITEPGQYRANLLVNSNDPLQPVVTIPVTLTVVAPHYEVGLESSRTTQFASPGTTATYTIQLANQGDIEDTFTVAVGGATWPTTVPTSLGPLAAGETTPFVVTVDIPAQAKSGDEDTATVTVTSQGDNSQTASVTLTTRVATTNRVFLPLVVK